MYASIYIPDFSLQAVVRSEPDLRSRAAAIVDGAPPSCRVAAMNSQARRAGVRPGMTKLDASQVPLLAIRHRSRAQEAAAHAALLDLGLSVSPRVEDTAIDTLALDLTGLEQLFGSPEKIARRLAERASELGLRAQVAVASNPDAAIHAARGFRGITLIPAGEEAERLGSLPVDALAPAREILETLDRWGVRTFKALAALPTLQLSERLGQEGVRLQNLARGRTHRSLAPCEAPLNFEEVMDLEYPVALLEPLAFILGRLLDQLCARLEARSLATHEVRLRLDLEAGVEAETGAGVRTESRILNPESCPESRAPSPEPRTLRLPVPTRDAKLLLKLWLLHLKSDPPPAPIIKVALAAEPAQPRVAQGGLFSPFSPDPEKLEVTLARIAGVVGKGKVGTPELVDTHRPDAFRMGRFTSGVGGRGSGLGVSKIEDYRFKIADWEQSAIGNQQSSIANRQSSRIPNPGPQTPNPGPQTPNPESRAPNPDGVPRTPTPGSRPLMALRVFRPPLPATVEVRDGRPVRVFSSSGARGEVVSATGPWRTSGEWWTEDGWQQDEWDVELKKGPGIGGQGTGGTTSGIENCRLKIPDWKLKIYQDLGSGRWFIRGIYD